MLQFAFSPFARPRQQLGHEMSRGYGTINAITSSSSYVSMTPQIFECATSFHLNCVPNFRTRHCFTSTNRCACIRPGIREHLVYAVTQATPNPLECPGRQLQFSRKLQK